MMKQCISFFRIIILYIALASPAILWAQESFTNRYNTIYITMNEGLPNNFVDDIYKDRQGFLWISMSGGGLSRYDGYEFVNFTPATPHCRLKSNFHTQSSTKTTFSGFGLYQKGH